MNFLLDFPAVPGSVLALAFCGYLQSYSQNRKRADWLTAAIAVALPMNILAQALVTAMGKWRPYRLDLYAYQFDAWLGEPSFRIGQALVCHEGWIGSSVPCLWPVSFGDGVRLRVSVWCRTEAETLALAKTFAIAWLTLPVLYVLCPISGPAFAFPQFPGLPAHVVAHGILLDAPPNGMPSGHFTCALLVAWFLRHWRWGRVSGALFVVLTLLATLGSGQHYAIDLIAALAYTAALLAWRRL
jgi:hypothetical protein